MSLKVGGKAPEFSAPAYFNGRLTDVRLSDAAGKWTVLFFYPGDFTFVCPTEIVALANQQKQLTELDVQVYLVSVDSHFVHMAWEQNELKKLLPEGVPFPMVADPSGNIGRAYGVFDEDINVDIRGRFIIDPDGNVVAAEVLTAPVGRNIPEIIRQIRAFRKVRASGGNAVCPAGWRDENDQMLKPGADLVGKVADVWKA